MLFYVRGYSFVDTATYGPYLTLEEAYIKKRQVNEEMGDVFSTHIEEELEAIDIKEW